MMIPLWERDVPFFDASKKQFPPSLSPFLLSGENNPCCIVIPGGGYQKKAWDHEGIQIAEWLNGIGMSAFVLDYRISPYDGDAILADGRQAICLVRARASEFGIDPNRLGVCGFSAGGHLAGCCATMFETAQQRPDFAILCYGVLTLERNENRTHKNTSAVFLGKNAQDEQMQLQYSPVHRVTKDCPATFLWTTDTDKTVPPVPSTYAMYDACKRENVPVEMVTFDHGPHGLGIPKDDPEIASWTIRCEQWMKKTGIL